MDHLHTLKALILFAILRGANYQPSRSTTRPVIGTIANANQKNPTAEKAQVWLKLDRPRIP